MSNNLKVFFLSFTIISILVFSAFGTTGTVYADGDTPPVPTDSSTPVADDGNPQGATEVPTEDVLPGVAETPVSAEQDPAAVVETALPDATTTQEVAAAPILEQLPENTTLAVLDANGEAQPLATLASADAIESAYDPIWCPAGQSPTPGANGCTGSFNSFAALLTFLKTNEINAAYQQAGTIFIQEGQYLGGESSVNFNNYNFNHLNNYNLTLQGGWNTSNNSTTSTTQFNVPITIGSTTNPWIGSLTLYNMNISNVSGQTGLVLNTQGNITVGNVEVTNSLNGVDLTAGGNVTINDSNFNKNKKTGANINAGGTVGISNTSFNENGSSTGNTGKGLEIGKAQNVSLAGVTANNNQAFGANIKASGTVTVTDSFFSGNQSYTYHCSSREATGGYGLQVVTTADISLDGVTASDNFLFGGDLTGKNVEVLNSSFNDNGSGSDKNPTGYGLKVAGTGVVTLDTVNANHNQLFGANIQTSDAVVVMNSFFDGNQSYTYSCSGKKSDLGYGLKVVTTGAIVLDTVSASDNSLYGADLDGSLVVVDGGTLNNNGKGLKIKSASIVALSNVQANENKAFGADVTATEDVTIVNSFFSGQKTYAYDCHGNAKYANGGGYGLKVVSGGTVALTAVEATDNYTYGAHLDGSTVTIAQGKFSGNGSGAEDKPTGFGLEVISSGQATLDGVEANNNQLFGANIQAGDTVTVANSFFSGHQSYTFNPCRNQFDYFGYGLQVTTTAGTIDLNGVEGNHNNLWGAKLTGLDVNIANSKFNNNVTVSQVFIDDTGLLVESAGTVTLDNVQANENRLIGATIHATGDVLINESVFSGNRGTTCQDQWCHQITYNGYGLNVVAGGYVELNEVTANDNNLFGAHLEGSSVSIFSSTFNNNGAGDNKLPTGKGLEVISTGEVTLINVEASNNELFGANIKADGVVTVLSSIFAGNNYYTYSPCKGTSAGGYGLKVVSTGEIVLGATEETPDFGVQAYDNGAEGAILEGTSTISVTNSSFHDNGADGLKITANGGNVTLTNVTATGNGGDGVDVTGTCTNTMFVNGGTFANNDKFGIRTANIIYSPNGTQIFGGNDSGNLFQSSTCVTSGSSSSQTGSQYGNGGSHSGSSWQRNRSHWHGWGR